MPIELKEALRDVDLILHAGDVYTVAVLDELESIAPILVAQGDDDRPEVLEDPRVKEKQVLEIEGVTIWVTHIKPWSFPYDIKGSPAVDSSRYEKLPDIFVVGHTHNSGIEKVRDVLVVSPGSATFPQYRRELGTIGLLSINSGKAEVQIVQL